MDHRLREFFVTKIRLGTVYIKEFDILIKPAELTDVIAAYEVYSNALEEAISDGLMTIQENENYMLNTGQWTNLDEDNLKDVNTLVEDVKVAMYKNYSDSKQLKSLRKSLSRKQKLYKSLLFKKNANYSNTAESFAETARLLFLVERCSDTKDIDIEENINTIISSYNASIFDDTIIRDLCRNEPWRSTWSVRNECKHSLFPNEELTTNQKNLVLWSKSYDGIHESPDCPPQDVIDDDDCLDGWFIFQSRKRKSEANKTQTEDMIGNEKVKNSDNVFVIANSDKQVQAIHDANSPDSKDIKKRRSEAIKTQGTISHEKLPDRQAQHKANIQQGLKKG